MEQAFVEESLGGLTQGETMPPSPSALQAGLPHRAQECLLDCPIQHAFSTLWKLYYLSVNRPRKIQP